MRDRSNGHRRRQKVGHPSSADKKLFFEIFKFSRLPLVNSRDRFSDDGKKTCGNQKYCFDMFIGWGTYHLCLRDSQMPESIYTSAMASNFSRITKWEIQSSYNVLLGRFFHKFIVMNVIEFRFWADSTSKSSCMKNPLFGYTSAGLFSGLQKLDLDHSSF